ncbi:zinc-binding dehydrogenase [Allokutzneria oryzae]|uniref:Zinc-binding dehydrogenase n=1 Tax=Allokutzneria oryzae TaxID=1378989 RepID=A0ABV5ZYI8_9PSEU
MPGGGVAGRVGAVGEAVDRAWVGRQVVAKTASFGGYAERVVVGAEDLVGVPDGLEPRTAAALLHDGPTALELFDNADVKTGDRVLVTAAAGGLGIQLVHAAGATVIGAARGARKLDLAREHGADVVFDGVGGEIGRAALGITRRGGWFSAHGVPSGSFTTVSEEEAKRLGVTVRGIDQVQFSGDKAVRLAERALSEAAAGRLRPVVGQTFPLADAAAAHAAVESRAVLGKTLLLV